MVATLGPQGVIEIGESHDPRGEGYVLALEAIGITAAIPLLMVRPRHIDTHAQEMVIGMPQEDLFEGVGAKSAVGLHDRELLRGQLPGFQ